MKTVKPSPVSAGVPQSQKSQLASAPSVTYRSGRAKLPARREPYWHLIAPGQHLGYRKGKRGGTWIAKFYRPGKGRVIESLGQADDTAEADGQQVLSFKQAGGAAREFAAAASRADHAGVRLGRYTVEDAAKDWLATFAGSANSKATSERNTRQYILPALGSVPVEKLTRQQVQSWLFATAATPTMRSQSATGRKPCDMNDPETQRRRKESANRVFNDLKAMLTLAYRNQHCSSKAAWETVDRIPNVSKVRRATLDIEEALRVMDACEPDFRRMVFAALATGCRWGELCDLRVENFYLRAGRLDVWQKKPKKWKHVGLTEEELAFFAENTAGKPQAALIFVRADGSPWGKSDQQDRMDEVIAAANTRERVTFHGLRHTVGRWLAEKNLPMGIIAKHLGHANSRVTEEFYAHYSDSHVHDAIRASKPSLSPVERAKRSGLRLVSA